MQWQRGETSHQGGGSKWSRSVVTSKTDETTVHFGKGEGIPLSLHYLVVLGIGSIRFIQNVNSKNLASFVPSNDNDCSRNNWQHRAKGLVLLSAATEKSSLQQRRPAFAHSVLVYSVPMQSLFSLVLAFALLRFASGCGLPHFWHQDPYQATRWALSTSFDHLMAL